MKLKVPWLLMYSMNNMYCTSHGCKTTVRAAEWRDTEGVGGYSDHNDTHTHTQPQSHSASSIHSFTDTCALTGRVRDCTQRDTASFS